MGIVHDALIVKLSHDQRQFRVGFPLLFNQPDSITDAWIAAVSCLYHIEIKQRAVGELCGGCVGRMYSKRTFEGVCLPDIAGKFCPQCDLFFLCFGTVFAEVKGHSSFTRSTPYNRVGTPPCNDISPVLPHLLLSHREHIVSPCPYNTRHNTHANKQCNTRIGFVEIGGVDGFVLRFPRQSCFVGSTGIKIVHIGKESGNKLNNRKPFLFSLFYKRGKLIRKA